MNECGRPIPVTNQLVFQLEATAENIHARSGALDPDRSNSNNLFAILEKWVGFEAMFCNFSTFLQGNPNKIEMSVVGISSSHLKLLWFCSV